MPLETGIYTLTPLHCGTGQAVGAVDLPVAREAHTGHPMIPSSSLKGVLRSLAKANVEEVFGSEPPKGGAGQLKPGSLVITDGQLLALPVRALDAPFYWLTCPLVVRRWARLLDALGLSKMEVSSLAAMVEVEGKAAREVVVEDQAVPKVLLKSVGGTGELVKRWARFAPADEDFAERLLIVDDVVFSYLAQRATTVRARVQLDPETKTTDPNGNLWYEETVPPDTLFAAFVATRDGTTKADPAKTVQDILQSRKVVQIGGHETVGQGFCRWSYAAPAAPTTKGGK